MSFLAPLFLFGALATALPVVFHLIRRMTRERTTFSSLMFLLPTPPRLTRRSRLEHLLLLVLRCLVLGLLAFGFARPFLKGVVNTNPSSAAPRRTMVLVDTSASMRRANLWAEARDQVASVLRHASPADEVALSTFDRQVRPLVTFDQWQSAAAGERAALVNGKLAATSPGWAATHLGDALIAAAEALADTGGKTRAGPQKIVLITDLQAGSRLDPLQGYEWPQGVALSVQTVKARHPGNAGLQLVTGSDDAVPEAGAGVRVRVSNAADSQREQFTLGWGRADGRGMAGASVTVYVPPGQSRIVPVPAPATGVATDRIVLQGDDEDFDNTVFVVPPETALLRVLYLGRDSETDPRQPLYFLERGFQETRRQIVQVLFRPPDAPLPAADAQAAALVVVTDPLPETRAETLHDLVAAGHTLLFALKSDAAAPTLARLCGLARLEAVEARPNNYALLAEIDFRHPLFAPFADPRFSDFTKIHFWKYRRLDAAAIPGARVVASFDSGAPALLEVPVGQGRVLVLTSGWQPDDSQLALSTKFVPLLYSMLDYAGATAPAPEQYFVGDIVPLAAARGADKSALTIRVPDGSQLNLDARETNFSLTMTPGIYSVTSVQPPKRFAVNLDPAESRTAPLPVDELERLGAPIAHPTLTVTREVERKVRLENTEQESRQKLWRWVLVATLAVLLVETWLAGRTARRLTAQGGATP